MRRCRRFPVCAMTLLYLLTSWVIEAGRPVPHLSLEELLSGRVAFVETASAPPSVSPRSRAALPLSTMSAPEVRTPVPEIASIEQIATLGQFIYDLARLDDGTILAVTADGTVHRSADAGTTWASSPLQGARGAHSLCDLGNGTVLAGAYFYSHGAGLYRSRDGGRTWEYLTGFSGIAVIFEILRLSDGTVLITGSTGSPPYGNQILRSVDNGVTFEKVFEDTSYSSMTDLIDAGDGVVFGTANDAVAGIWRSTDSGLTWVKSALLSHRKIHVRPRSV